MLVPVTAPTRGMPFDVAHTLLWRLLVDSTITDSSKLTNKSPYARRDAALHKVLCKHQLQILIATVPDPVDSHLDWMYDLHVAAIRWALATKSYVPDSYWVPWATQVRPEPVPSLESRGRTQREAFPGVMLFRRGPRDSSIVVVYLVGESPTNGVRKLALRTAIWERDALLSLAPKSQSKAIRDTLRVIGPTFLASAASLAAVLTSTEREHAWRYASAITGSATQEGIRATLDSVHNLAFAATVHSDSAFDRARNELVVKRWLGGDQTKLAILSERSTTPEGDSFVHVRLPPTIAALREAYERDSQTVSPSSMPSDSRFRVPLSLHDVPREAEYPGPTSALTAATLDEEMEDIARMLRTRDVRVVQLSATDVRDNLFLARDLRRRVPDIQILAYGRHSLYARSADLAGMLVLSSYPPGLRNQGRVIADTADSNRRLVFATDGAEGTYNATLLQLGDGAPLIDYQWPFDTKRNTPSVSQPPIWLSIVGSDDLVPLAVFRDSDTGRARVTFHQCTDSGKRRVIPVRKDTDTVWNCYMYDPTFLSGIVGPKPPTQAVDPLPAYGAILVGLIAFWVAWKDRGLWILRIGGTEERKAKGWIHRILGIEDLMANLRERKCGVGDKKPVNGSLAYGVIGLLSIAIAFVSSGAAVAHTSLNFAWTSCGVRILLILMFLVSIVVPAVGYVIASVWTVYDACKQHASPTGATIGLRNDPGRFVQVLLIALSLVLVCWYLYPVFRPNTVADSTGPLLTARVAAIHSGVSPVLPLVLIGLGQCMWARWHLGRRRIVASEPCIGRWLAPDEQSDHRRSSAGRYVRQLRAQVCSSASTKATWLLVVLLLVAAGLYSSLLFRQPAEVISAGVAGNRGMLGFGTVFTLGALAGMAAPIWISYRLVAASKDLHDLLQTIEGTRICSAFERLPTFAVRLTQLSVFGDTWLERQDVLLRVGETQLRHVRNLYAGYVSLGKQIALPHDNQSVCLDTIFKMLRRFWRTEPEPAVVTAARRMDATIPARRDLGTYVLQSSTSSQFRRAFPTDPRLFLRGAEEWLAVQIVAYVEWAIEYLRHMVQYLLGSMIITTLLFASYPFHPQAQIERLFLAEMIGAAIVVVVKMADISREEVVAAISNTTPGRVSWDRDFALNLMLISAVPLVTLLSVFFPSVGDFLFAWVRPLLGAIGGRT
jgi:hypothetical protein